VASTGTAACPPAVRYRDLSLGDYGAGMITARATFGSTQCEKSVPIATRGFQANLDGLHLGICDEIGRALDRQQSCKADETKPNIPSSVTVGVGHSRPGRRPRIELCASICSFVRLLSSSVIDRPCIGPNDATRSCAVIANGFVLIVEIVPEHVFWILRRAYWFGGYRRHFAEIVDLPRENQGVIELLLGADFELSGDVHVLRAREHLGIDYVGDDGLDFAGKVFVQQLREPVAGNFVFICGGLGLSRLVPPSSCLNQGC
jgi:hypothetical protein